LAGRCDSGACCTFREIDGTYTGCFDLLTRQTTCGLSCETIVNCLNTDQQCVNGECVDFSLAPIQLGFYDMSSHCGD
jgi:hypothetical protein